MSEHWMVKFKTPKGETVYGVVYSMDDEEKKAAPKGNILVQDAVLPKSYWVPEDRLVDIESDVGRYDLKTGDWKDQDEYHTYVSEQHKVADNLSESLPDGVQVGKLFGVGAGDGTAWYVVTKVSKDGKKADVEWRGFCMDRWTDHYFGWGRKSVPVRDLARYCGRRGLFRKKTA